MRPTGPPSVSRGPSRIPRGGRSRGRRRRSPGRSAPRCGTAAVRATAGPPPSTAVVSPRSSAPSPPRASVRCRRRGYDVGGRDTRHRRPTGGWPPGGGPGWALTWRNAWPAAHPDRGGRRAWNAGPEVVTCGGEPPHRIPAFDHLERGTRGGTRGRDVGLDRRAARGDLRPVRHPTRAAGLRRRHPRAPLVARGGHLRRGGGTRRTSGPRAGRRGTVRGRPADLHLGLQAPPGAERGLLGAPPPRTSAPSASTTTSATPASASSTPCRSAPWPSRPVRRPRC